MRSILEDRLGWSSITQSQLEDEYLRIMHLAGPESISSTRVSDSSSSWMESGITRIGPPSVTTGVAKTN